MKRILITLVFGLVFSFFTFHQVEIVSAQNTFDCNDNNPDGECRPVNSSCNSGFDVDPAVCSNADNCNGTVNQPCVSVTPPAQKCSCISGLCTPDGNGSMLCSACNSPTANAACTTSTPKFKCTSPQVGCQQCAAGDNSCTLSAADCANSCTPNVSFQKCNTSNYSCVNCANSSDPGCVPASTCLSTCKVPLNTYDAIKCKNGGTGVDTAIGCVPINSITSLTTFALRWGIGIAGGIAFLLIIYAGILIMTSAGDPKRLQTGQELMTSAVAGIILIIFSIFVLRLIGVNILGLF